MLLISKQLSTVYFAISPVVKPLNRLSLCDRTKVQKGEIVQHKIVEFLEFGTEVDLLQLDRITTPPRFGALTFAPKYAETDQNLSHLFAEKC